MDPLYGSLNEVKKALTELKQEVYIFGDRDMQEFVYKGILGGFAVGAACEVMDTDFLSGLDIPPEEKQAMKDIFARSNETGLGFFFYINNYSKDPLGDLDEIFAHLVRLGGGDADEHMRKVRDFYAGMNKPGIKEV